MQIKKNTFKQTNEMNNLSIDFIKKQKNFTLTLENYF